MTATDEQPLFFDTDPAWIRTIVEWAKSQDDVRAIWLFGSRITGCRTPKANPSPVPDLDVALEMCGRSPGERTAAVIDVSESWDCDVKPGISVDVSLEHYDPRTGDLVALAINRSGLCLYRAE